MESRLTTRARCVQWRIGSGARSGASRRPRVPRLAVFVLERPEVSVLRCDAHAGERGDQDALPSIAKPAAQDECGNEARLRSSQQPEDRDRSPPGVVLLRPVAAGAAVQLAIFVRVRVRLVQDRFAQESRFGGRGHVLLDRTLVVAEMAAEATDGAVAVPAAVAYFPVAEPVPPWHVVRV